jgi:pSer/pThr/pTyr-binding forkhead associated (FHA) protein
VVLSLSADRSSGADVLFPERRITLYDGKDSITIGRASKISTKGFVAGIDNAWFDSPVMSRLHARLFARMDQKVRRCNPPVPIALLTVDQKVEIRDLGSLHGTYVNDGERLAADELRELQDGDTLRFGAPIWRGQDQFVPTKVTVGLQFPTR